MVHYNNSLYSVLILTKDEEINIGDCIASIPAGVAVFVLDSVSKDRTFEIAQSNGAKVFFRNFDNYASQRNYGLRHLEYTTSWVFMLDADERMTQNLHEEIVYRLSLAEPEVTLFRMRRKDMFMGRWLRRSSGYPTWFGRLARLGAVHVEREINEEFVTTGNVAYLRNHLIHYPFKKGISYWIERHNRYSSMEARKLVSESYNEIDWSSLFNRDPAVRRKYLKQIVYRLPCRPVIIFVYLYFWRGGFLDGKPGLVFCTLRFVYECMISIKMQDSKSSV